MILIIYIYVSTHLQTGNVCRHFVMSADIARLSNICRHHTSRAPSADMMGSSADIHQLCFAAVHSFLSADILLFTAAHVFLAMMDAAYAN